MASNHAMHAQAEGRLSTHVLDTALGKPAAGMKITLYRLQGAGQPEGREKLLERKTNADGRTDGPLLSGPDLQLGHYELVFAAGDYLRQTTGNTSEILFLDQIPIRFGIFDAKAHYHVPLLISPYAYSTYRGS